MIYQLLQDIAKLLRTEMAALIPQAESAIQVRLQTNITEVTPPALLIAPGTWSLSPGSRDILTQPTFTLREFQHAFTIQIFADALPLVEQWASLITGVVLSSHDTLIQQFNAPEISDNKTEYQSQRFITTHSLNSFTFVNGAYLFPDPLKQEPNASSRSRNQTGSDLIVMQLNWTAVGQMKMAPIAPEGDRPIETVTISLSDLENRKKH